MIHYYHYNSRIFARTLQVPHLFPFLSPSSPSQSLRETLPPKPLTLSIDFNILSHPLASALNPFYTTSIHLTLRLPNRLNLLLGKIHILPRIKRNSAMLTHTVFGWIHPSVDVIHHGDSLTFSGC